jgi:hypothetical protein
MRVPNQPSLFQGRQIVWFSCGVASACAAKLAVESGATEVVYCDTSEDEHPDNRRFLGDVERWIGQPITVIESDCYRTVDDVNAVTGYMAGIGGARCTTELKKIPRLRFENPGDVHVFGFTADERGRIASFEANNPELYLRWILLEAGMTKTDCFEMVQAAGIEIPAMYRLGYRNNNCRGCVKATSPAYWNMIRRDFPDVFAVRAERSRRLGVRLVRLHGERIFLDELPVDDAEDYNEDLSCGPQCGIVEHTAERRQVSDERARRALPH